MGIKQIKAAQNRIKKIIRKTPLEYSSYYSRSVNAEVYLKLENIQLTGSFKIRGALNRMFKLSSKEKKKGVVTASAGNHAQGVAYGAKLLGVKATIIVPKTTPKTKIKAIKRYGVNLKVFGEDFDKAEAKAHELEKSTGMIFISPYNDLDVIAGQGTIALEILKEKPDINMIIVPIGGGGLISGIAIAAKSINPKIKITGVQSTSSPCMYESIKAGKIIRAKLKPSIAEGIHANIEKDSITFDFVKKHVDKILLVNESEIKKAIKFLLENHHQIAEGAGAVGLAALLKYKKQFKKRKIAVVISGSNIDMGLLKKIIC